MTPHLRMNRFRGRAAAISAGIPALPARSSVRVPALAAALLTACMFPPPADVEPGDPGDPGDPVQPGGSPARCASSAPFAAPALVASLNQAGDQAHFSVASDETIGFVTREAAGTLKLLATRRASATAAWEAPSDALTAAINGGGEPWGTSPTADGLTLYFDRGPGVFVATRSASHAAFSAGEAITVNGVRPLAMSPAISTDGNTLYWIDPDTYAIRAASREAGSRTRFEAPRTVASFPSDTGITPVLSADEHTMFYADGGTVRVSTRSSTAGVFEPGPAVPNLASGGIPVALSQDDCVLYLLGQGTSSTHAIWAASRRP